MTTALTVFQANAASTTTGLTTANQFYAGSSGSPAVNQLVTIMGTATGFGEILPRGGSAWTAGGSLPSPSGNGFVLDANTLDSQQIVSGTWSAEVRFCAMQGASQAGTLVADIYVRAYRYSSGTYTNIVTMKLATQTINSTLTTYLIDVAHSATGTSGSAITFATGDKLYCDIICNITTNANANVTQGIRNNRMSTDTSTFVGDINASVTTPGYQSAGTNVSLTITETATGSELVSTNWAESISESATGSEIVTAGNLQSNSITETAQGSEIVTTAQGQQRFVVEVATGSEIITTAIAGNMSIVETAQGSELVTAGIAKIIVETAQGSELVTAGNLSTVSIVETAQGSEIISFFAFTKLVTSVTETAQGSEIAVMLQGIQSPGNVQMQNYDLTTQYSRIYANIVGSQLKLLATTYYGNANNNQVIYGELDAVMEFEQIADMHVMKTINDVNAFLLSMEYIANVLSDNPIAYYRLNESAGAVAYDIAGNNYSGAITGGVLQGAAGALVSSLDTAYDFDGTSGLVSLSNGIQPGNWTGIYIECWLSIPNTSYSGARTIIANADPTSTNNGFALSFDAGGAGITFSIGNGATFATCHYVHTFTANTYYQLVVKWDGTTIRMYVNGNSVQTASLSGNVITAANSINLAHSPVGSGDFFPGNLQSVSIYNYALSSARVTAHYNAGVTP